MTVGELLGLTEHADGWGLPLVGRDVDQICFDFAVTLVVDGSDTVRLLTPFTLHAEGADHAVDPRQFESVLPVLALHRAAVLTARVGKDGALHLRFDGGRVLRAAPDENEQAWEVSGGLPPVTPAYQITAQPGGGVSVH